MSGLRAHTYHIVDPSPWPLMTSGSSLNLTLGGVGYFHTFLLGGFTTSFGGLSVVSTSATWWRDVIREGLSEGHHTSLVQISLKLGMLFFIVSEVMFFSSFFWGFFHSSLAPTIEIGSVWPPVGISVLDPWEVPFLNTVILLSSGLSITWAHHALLLSFREQAHYGFLITIFFAIFFTILQLAEYVEATFSISDGIYGSTFFMATGFHGFHVIIGTIFIIVSYIRFLNYHFSDKHHVGFESAAWYWHFVDVVWLFLFISIYWWGNKSCNANFIDYSTL